MDTFIEQMKELLDTETELEGTTVLASIEEWDSLSFVSFLAFAATTCGKRISAEELRKAQTVNDLFVLIR
ncbi:hypothetical protein [Desulfovibrio cuneatus]|uniref:hypothetical protein n=1 Tax=Desulfovibrio cuneatus TaxID=159728 RepID=UPI0004185574|nr:hypothetical protein [Desulfovibrio cuneatus]